MAQAAEYEHTAEFQEAMRELHSPFLPLLNQRVEAGHADYPDSVSRTVTAARDYLRRQAELHCRFLAASELAGHDQQVRLRAVICEAAEEIIRTSKHDHEVGHYRDWLIDQVGRGGREFAVNSIYEAELLANPARWVDSWPEFEEAEPRTRQKLSSDLLLAYADASDEAERRGRDEWDAGWALIRRAYDVIAEALLDIGELSSDRIEGRIVEMVFDVVCSVPSCPLLHAYTAEGDYHVQVGHYALFRDRPAILRNFLNPEISKARGRLVEAQLRIGASLPATGLTGEGKSEPQGTAAVPEVGANGPSSINRVRSLSDRDQRVHKAIGKENFCTLTNAEVRNDKELRKILYAEKLKPGSDAAKSCLDRIRNANGYPLSRQVTQKRSAQRSKTVKVTPA